MALRFSEETGNNSHIHCGNPVPTRNLFLAGGSIVWRVRPEAGFGENGTGRILAKNSGSASPSGGYILYLEANDIVFGKGFNVDNAIWESNGAVVATGVYHNGALTYNGTLSTFDPTMYHDGASTGTTETSNPDGSPDSDVTNDLILGNVDDLTRDFDGRIAYVRLYDRILTANEVLTIHNCEGHDGIVHELVADYRMDEGPPTTIGFPTDLFRIAERTIDTTTGSSFSMNVPSEIEDGDLMIAALLMSGNSGSSGTAPNLSDDSGNWNLLNSGNTDVPGTGSRPGLWVYYKTASSEPASYTWSITNMNSNGQGLMLGFLPSGLTLTPETVPSIINTGDSSSPVCPSVSISSDSLVLRIFANDDNDAITLPLATSIPIGEATSDGADNNGSNLKVAFEVVTGATTGTLTGSLPGSEAWGCLTVTFEGATTAQLSDFNPTKDYSGTKENGVPDGIPPVPTFRDGELSFRKRV